MPSEDHGGALATSIDGRHFLYDIAADDLDVRVGGYVVIGDTRLGYVTSVALGSHDGASGLGSRPVCVEGRLLEGPDRPFGATPARVAAPAEVARWLDAARPARAVLDVGSLTFAESVPLALDAGAFDRHTFLCGQSGSGKTYALGTILERLLAETSLRIVILDPNSDFVRLAELRDEVEADTQARYAAAARGIEVRKAGDAGADRLHVRFRDFDAAERAAVLRLDPIADREEYSALVEAIEHSGELIGATVQETVERMRARPQPLRSLAMRASNLGVDRWQVWSGNDPGSLEELVQPGGPRCVVVDFGSLATRGEQAVAAEAVLAALWRRRGAREPMLIVIDEAHNVCPGRPEDPLTALATEHAVRIAGEGRKFGLVLLAATQRPQKVHENVVSQCDNLVLMRMNSRSDLAILSEIFSFVPASLLALATEFGQGEAVVAGKLVPSPTLGRFGPRWSMEGGADVPSDWAVAGD
jgi:DNA helicase HerA-like ATPase